jgi:hypothetical protein
LSLDLVKNYLTDSVKIIRFGVNSNFVHKNYTIYGHSPKGSVCSEMHAKFEGVLLNCNWVL